MVAVFYGEPHSDLAGFSARHPCRNLGVITAQKMEDGRPVYLGGIPRRRIHIIHDVFQKSVIVTHAPIEMNPVRPPAIFNFLNPGPRNICLIKLQVSFVFLRSFLFGFI